GEARVLSLLGHDPELLGAIGDAAMPEVVDAVVAHRQGVFEPAPLRADPHARLVPEAHRVDFHVLVPVHPVRSLLVDLDSHDGAAAGDLGLDDHARLGRHPGRQQGPGQATVGGPHVQPGVADVATAGVTGGLGHARVAVLLPERIDVGRPAMVVGVGTAAVAREALAPVQIAVLAGDAADLVVTDRQVGDDLLQLAV